MGEDEHITDPGAAEEEIPQNEEELNEEEVSEEEPQEEKKDPEKIALFKNLGLDENGKPFEAEEEEEVKKEPQEEEPIEEEDKHFSKGVQRRINEMRRKQGDAERAAEIAKKEAAELKAKLEQYESGQPPTPPAQEEPAGPTAKEQAEEKVAELKVKISEKRKELKAAREDLDYDKEFELDDEIEDLKEQIREEKNKANNPAVDYREQAAKAAFEHSLQIATKEFAARNDWFKQLDKDGNPSATYDHFKSNAALRISNELEKNFDGTPHEFFKEVERRVALEFPSKSPNQKIPNVAGATKVRSMKQSKKELNIDEKTSRMLAGIFGDDVDKINRVIQNVQSKRSN